jgi:hypothetical protein
MGARPSMGGWTANLVHFNATEHPGRCLWEQPEQRFREYQLATGGKEVMWRATVEEEQVGVMVSLGRWGGDS